MIDTKDLVEIGKILQMGLDSNETYEAVFHLLERTVQFDSATLFVYNEEEDKLEIVLKRGDKIVDLAENISFARGMGISSYISKKEKPIILESLSRSLPGKMDRFSSFVSMPLRIGDKLIGVLNLGHNEPGTYRKEQQEDFTTIATQISLVMEKLILRATLDEKNRKLKKALEDLTAAQDELVEKKRMAAIGEIVVTVNHKINNPLTTIMNHAQLLPVMIETRNQKKAKNAALKIQQAATEIKEVTHHLTHLESTNTEGYLENVRMIQLPEER